jgi:acyl carrier protein
VNFRQKKNVHVLLDKREKKMSNDNKSKIKKVVSEQLKITDETLMKPATLLEDLGADEFDMMEIIMKLEDQFSLVIEEEEVEKISTFEELNQYIEKRKQEK